MTAGKLLAFTIVGFTLVAGFAQADLLPTLPPPPSMPGFPQTPPIPAPTLPVQTQQCVNLVNEYGVAASGTLVAARDQSFGAFGHQSAQLQAVLSAASEATSVDQAGLGNSIVAFANAENYTIQNITRAFGRFGDGVNATSNGFFPAASHAVNESLIGSSASYNETYAWAYVTENRTFNAVYPFVNGTYNNALGDYTRIGPSVLAFFNYVNAGPSMPVASVSGPVGVIQSDVNTMVTSTYGLPAATAEAVDILGYNVLVWSTAAASTGIGFDQGGPEAFAAAMQSQAGIMTAYLQSDAAALQGTLTAAAGYSSAWTLGLPARAPGCATIGI